MGRKRQGFIDILAEWVENDKDLYRFSVRLPSQGAPRDPRHDAQGTCGNY